MKQTMTYQLLLMLFMVLFMTPKNAKLAHFKPLTGTTSSFPPISHTTHDPQQFVTISDSHNANKDQIKLVSMMSSNIVKSDLANLNSSVNTTISIYNRNIGDNSGTQRLLDVIGWIVALVGIICCCSAIMVVATLFYRYKLHVAQLKYSAAKLGRKFSRTRGRSSRSSRGSSTQLAKQMGFGKNSHNYNDKSEPLLARDGNSIHSRSYHIPLQTPSEVQNYPKYRENNKSRKTITMSEGIDSCKIDENKSDDDIEIMYGIDDLSHRKHFGGNRSNSLTVTTTATMDGHQPIRYNGHHDHHGGQHVLIQGKGGRGGSGARARASIEEVDSPLIIFNDDEFEGNELVVDDKNYNHNMYNHGKFKRQQQQASKGKGKETDNKKFENGQLVGDNYKNKHYNQKYNRSQVSKKGNMKYNVNYKQKKNKYNANGNYNDDDSDDFGDSEEFYGNENQPRLINETQMIYKNKIYNRVNVNKNATNNRMIDHHDHNAKFAVNTYHPKLSNIPSGDSNSRSTGLKQTSTFNSNSNSQETERYSDTL